MKTLLICVVAGLMAGLIGCLLSGWQSPGYSRSNGVPQAAGPARSFARPASPLAASPSSEDATGRPRVVSREEKSRQLQLEIARALVSLDDEARDRAYTQLLPALIAIDPAAVEHLVERCPTGPVRDQLLWYTALAWSAANLDGAITWVEGLKNDDERGIAANEVVSQVAQGDPARALEVSAVFGIGRRDGTADHIAQLWAVEDLKGALQWIQAQPQGPPRDQLLARIVVVQAQSAPADAAHTALTRIAPGPMQDDAVVAVLELWSGQDADAASAWVEELPQGHLRDLAQAEIARSAGG